MSKLFACWLSEYCGKTCLESNTAFGFFKSENDLRPSNCCWVKKNVMPNLVQLSLDDFKGECNE